MALHKCSVYNLGAAASGKTQYERTILSRFESLDTTDDIVRDIFRRLLSVLPDDNSPTDMSESSEKNPFSFISPLENTS